MHKDLSQNKPQSRKAPFLSRTDRIASHRNFRYALSLLLDLRNIPARPDPPEVPKSSVSGLAVPTGTPSPENESSASLLEEPVIDEVLRKSSLVNSSQKSSLSDSVSYHARGLRKTHRKTVDILWISNEQVENISVQNVLNRRSIHRTDELKNSCADTTHKQTRLLIPSNNRRNNRDETDVIPTIHRAYNNYYIKYIKETVII